MSGKHYEYVAKEILDKTQNQFRRQQETDRQEMDTEHKPASKYEPTSSFSGVFSESIGKKDMPSLYRSFMSDPRLPSKSGRSPAKSEENGSESKTENQRSRNGTGALEDV